MSKRWEVAMEWQISWRMKFEDEGLHYENRISLFFIEGISITHPLYHLTGNINSILGS